MRPPTGAALPFYRNTNFRRGYDENVSRQADIKITPLA
jgi:hypothetical protein